MSKVVGVTSARVLGQQVNCVGHEEAGDSDHSSYYKQLPVFHRRKQLKKTHAEVRATDALGISSNRQKWEDRRDADDLKESLRKRERKNPGKLRSAVWARQKEDAPNQFGNVMNKPGHVSELHV